MVCVKYNEREMFSTETVVEAEAETCASYCQGLEKVFTLIHIDLNLINLRIRHVSYVVVTNLTESLPDYCVNQVVITGVYPLIGETKDDYDRLSATDGSYCILMQ